MAVNGVVYDHESLVMDFPGIGESLTLMEVNYDAKKDVDIVHGTNGLPRGVVRKKFEGAFDCSVARVEFNALVESVTDTGVLGAEPVAVSLSYGQDGDEPTVDELEVKITETGFGSKEDEEAVVKITGKQTLVPTIGGSEIYVDPLGRDAGGSAGGGGGPGVSSLSPSGAPFGL